MLADLGELFMRLESHKFSKLSFVLSQINKLLSSTIFIILIQNSRQCYSLFFIYYNFTFDDNKLCFVPVHDQLIPNAIIVISLHCVFDDDPMHI